MNQGSPVTITSTTDSAEAVQSALGKKVETKAAEPKAEPKESKPATEVKPPVENIEASGASEESEPESEEHDEIDASEESERPKKKGGYQKRVDKLTKRLSEREREIEYWKSEAMKKADVKPEPAKVEAKADLSKKPKSEDFEKHEDYVEALTDWKTEQKFQEKASKDRESSLKTDEQKKIDAHMAKVKEFKKAHADFNEAIEDLNDIPMSLTVREVILNSDNGPELMYALAQEKEEYARICKLPPVQAARELGRFEAKMKTAEAPSPKEAEPKTTAAPKPMKPVSSKTANVKTIRDELPYDEWRKLRDAEIKAHGGSIR